MVFGVSGGEAIDMALKIARAHTGKTEVISAFGGYHGHTGLALAAGDESFRKPFEPLAPGFIQVPFGDIKSLEEAIKPDTAAVIFETILGAYSCTMLKSKMVWDAVGLSGGSIRMMLYLISW